MPRALGDGPSLPLTFVSNPSQGVSCGPHLEMMGESLWAPNRTPELKSKPLCPCLPQTFTEFGKVSGPLLTRLHLRTE